MSGRVGAAEPPRITTAALDENGLAVTDPTATIDAATHGGTGSAIRVESGHSVAIVNGGLIKGGDEGSAISVLAEDSAQVINLAGGKIYGDPSETAVDARAYGGNITVSNGGDIYGSVSLLSDLGSVDLFNSDASGYSGGVGGTFHAYGESEFGGNGRFDNMFGTVKVDFGYDPVRGERLEAPPGYQPFATWSGLTSFDNSRGTIDLSGNGGGATLALGETTSEFEDDFTFHGSDVDGGRGSLVVDLVFGEEEGSIFSGEDWVSRAASTAPASSRAAAFSGLACSPAIPAPISISTRPAARPRSPAPRSAPMPACLTAAPMSTCSARSISSRSNMAPRAAGPMPTASPMAA